MLAHCLHHRLVDRHLQSQELDLETQMAKSPLTMWIAQYKLRQTHKLNARLDLRTYQLTQLSTNSKYQLMAIWHQIKLYSNMVIYGQTSTLGAESCFQVMEILLL